MNRILALLGALILLLAIVSPVAADDPTTTSGAGRVLLAINGDVTLPGGEQADAVIVINGTATISGTADSVVVVNGDVVTADAVISNLVVVRGHGELGAGTRILNDVRTLDATVDRDPAATVSGSIAGLEQDVAGVALFLGAAAILIWIGFGVATLLAALLLAALAARQIRSAGLLISNETGKSVLAGVLALIVPPVVAVLLVISIVGIPAGLGLLLVIWPAVAFIGYLVAAIWLGDWLLNRSRTAQDRPQRPYLAATVGVVVVTVAGIIPLFTFAISVVGMGAVLLAAWRTFRGEGARTMVLQAGPVPAG